MKISSETLRNLSQSEREHLLNQLRVQGSLATSWTGEFDDKASFEFATGDRNDFVGHGNDLLEKASLTTNDSIAEDLLFLAFHYFDQVDFRAGDEVHREEPI